MEEKKFAYRPREIDFYRAAETECWLSEMAERGLLLEKAGVFLCKFEKTEPKKVRYRLEPRGKNDPDEEYVEACKEAGWELVDCWKNTFLIWRCKQTEVPEFHTDHVAESYAFKRLSRSVMANAIVSLIGAAVIIMVVFQKYITAPVTQLVSDKELFSMVLFLSFLWMDIGVVRQWLSTSRLTKMLQSGKDIHQKVAVKHKLNWLPEAIYLASAIMMIIIPFYGIAQSRTGPADRFDLQIPRLAEIDEGIEIKEGLIINGVDYGNFVSTSWSYLAPEQLELHEQGYVDEELWEEWHQAGRKDSDMPITYEAKYYRLRFGFLAEPLMEEMAEDLSEELGISFEFIDGGDEAWYGCREKLQHLLLRRGNEFVHLKYIGPEKLSDRMDILISKLEE